MIDRAQKEESVKNAIIMKSVRLQNLKKIKTSTSKGPGDTHVALKL